MVLYCIIIGLAVYYLALWGWYRRVAVNNRTAPQPERKKRENTASLVGESHFRSGLMRTNGVYYRFAGVLVRCGRQETLR